MLNHRIIGRGTPILMLHGATLDHHHMMDVFEPSFQESNDWKRIYLDLPGHGKSTAHNDINTQDEVLEAVMAFVIERIAETSFAVVGLSRGSYIARGIIHLMFDRVIGTALIVPGGNPSSPHSLPSHKVLESDPSIKSELAESEIWAYENFSVVQRRNIVEKRRRIIAPAQELFDKEQEARVQKAFDFSFREAEEVSVFERPSLIVAGRQDSMSGYLESIDLMRRFPRATLGVLDAAGHGLEWERPDVFHALVRDWLARVSFELDT